MINLVSIPNFARTQVSEGSQSDGFKRVQLAVKAIAPEVDVVMQEGRVNYSDDGWKPLASLVFYNNGSLHEELTGSTKPSKLLISKVHNSNALLGKLQYN